MGRILFVCGILLSFSSCASYHYRVTIGVSQEAETRYGDNLSLEVDAAAVDADQEMEIKKDGVDDYFNPQTPLRERLSLKTVRFTREDRTRKKVRLSRLSGKSLLVIADLPPVTGVNTEHDGRFLLLPLKKTLFPQRVYIEVGATKIDRVSRKQLFAKPKKPKDIKE